MAFRDEGGRYLTMSVQLIKVDPDIRPYTLAALDKAVSVEELERQLLRPPVVATTCLSIDQ